jgi:opacity protein-like surface antigen
VQTSTRVETVAGPVNGLGNPTTYTKTYSISQQDDAKSYDQNVFFNLYYDFAQTGRFIPYVGAGIGVDARRFKRTSSQRAACVSATQTDPNLIPTTNPVACPPGFGHQNAYFSNDDKDSFAYGVAAALMLGASYELAPGLMIDSGYRLVWQGAEAELSGRGLFESTAIRISDKFEHEWRTGIRLDLN